MSDSQTYDPVTVSSDGVAVAKRFEADEFPVPAIAFRIESSRDETVTVRIVDTVPEDVAVEDLGFHPEYGSEYWTIDDQQITFERDMEAESEYTTVYGIRSTGTDNVEQFLTEPVIEMVDPPLEDDEGDVLDESSSDVVKDVIAGESDSVPGLEDDEEDEDIGTLNLKDPNEPGGQVADGEAADGEAAEGQGGAAAGTNVTRALLAEIKRGEVEDEVLTALKQTLGNGAGGGSGGGAADARIQHLQNEISDLAAYTEALEEFLAENGTGEQMIQDFRTQLNSFQDELDEIQSMAVQNREAVEGMESTVSQVEGKVDSIDGTVDSLDESVSHVESEVDEMSETVDSVTGEVEEIDQTVGSLEGRVDEVDAEVDEGLSSLESEVEDLRGELERVEENVGDDLDDRIDDIESEIDELKQWREQLSSVIGGGGD